MFTRQRQRLSLSVLCYLICLSPLFSCPRSISADEKQLSVFIFCLHYSLSLSSALLREPSWLRSRLVREVNAAKLANTPKPVIVKLQQMDPM